MKKAHYLTEEAPGAVSVAHTADGAATVELALNPVKVRIGDEDEQWEVDYTSFTFNKASSPVPSIEDISRRPEAYSTLSGDLDALKKTYVDAVQARMDIEARSHGYDDIFTAIGYTSSTIERFRLEAEACRDWRDAVWVHSNGYLADVMAGNAEVVPVDEFIAGLPQMQWPFPNE